MLRKTVFFVIILLIVNACGAGKKAKDNIERGHYSKAFNIAYTELAKDKNKKSNQKLIPSLKEAYTKAYDRDIHKIKLLKKENDPLNYKKIYATYVAMDIRQDDVQSLQPLYYEGKKVSFEIHDFTNDIAESLANYSDYLYQTGNTQLGGSKLEARKAYKTFNELEFVNPNYSKELSELIAQAKKKGSSFVLMKFQNNSGQTIDPKEVNDLLYINESNMQNKWVVYHSQQDQNIHYDYEVNAGIDEILISPERVNTETIPQQARIKDGWEYVYDANGNVAKDSLGNDIKRDKIITVQAEVRMFQQTKSARINGGIVVQDLSTNAQASSAPLYGEAAFENVFAQYRGDQRAIEQKYVQALQNKEVPFPTDDEILKASLADYKNRMLSFLEQQKL